MTGPWWYRILATFSTLVWINALWAAASLPIVTAPAAAVALHSGVRRLWGGEHVGWRLFVGDMRRRWAPATAVAAVLAVPWGLVAALVWAVRSGGGPLVQGAALALTVVVGAVTAIAPLVVAIVTGGSREALRRLGRAVVLRAGTALAALAAWTLTVVALITGPPRVVVLLALVAGSLPASVTALLAIHGGGRSTSPRTATARAALQPEPEPASPPQGGRYQ